MKLISSAFSEGGIIPSIYTCQGKNISPPLEFFDVPPSSKSLALILDDPDVPASVRSDRMYDHWVVYDMPADTRHLKEGTMAPGIQGKNTSGKMGYIGPCPPDREHRYFFKLYALNKKLDLSPGASKKELEAAMQGHMIAECHLMARYEKH
ncbi:MAG: YbhB/YbcL family Raf kinase inhibitor-like protein [Chlamydiia bacterium]|nr:YbhB/YbcL family Raf kinase inhibitor-like protein [Chlamydiia bacterium]